MENKKRDSTVLNVDSLASGADSARTAGRERSFRLDDQPMAPGDCVERQFPLELQPASWLLPNLRPIVLYFCYEFNQKINRFSFLSLQFHNVHFGSLLSSV